MTGGNIKNIALFNLLDDTLRSLLDAAPPSAAGVHFGTADISFETPEKGFAPRQGDLAINLFLYEVKENRELRQTMPDRDAMNGQAIRRRAPLRVDCSYMVTAWSNIQNQNNVANAHKLLGQAFNWLSRFPVIPDRYVQAGGLTGQLYAPPTMVAQMDGAKSAGEFWSALGVPPRPYFNLIVTICMDLDQSVEDSIVTLCLVALLPGGHCCGSGRADHDRRHGTGQCRQSGEGCLGAAGVAGSSAHPNTSRRPQWSLHI